MNRDILIDDIRIRGIGKGYCHDADGANLEERQSETSLQAVEVVNLKSLRLN